VSAQVFVTLVVIREVMLAGAVIERGVTVLPTAQVPMRTSLAAIVVTDWATRLVPEPLF
jgi:hypothetical protein